MGQLELRVETLTTHGEPWNDEQRIERLLDDLSDMGVDFEGNPRWPRAPLDSLAGPGRRQQFLKLMERTLGTLTGSS
jgi:hypothetical protein